MDTHMNTLMNMDTHTDTDMKTKSTQTASSEDDLLSCLQLLHLSDPLLPIGGFTHSYGLETYVQKELVNSSASAKKYLECYLKHNFLYNDLLAMRLAWEYAEAKDIDKIQQVSSILCAAKSPKELRNASTKLGFRFIKLVENRLTENDFFNSYLYLVKNSKCKSIYSVVYGITANIMNIRKDEAMCAISYSTASTIINNCAKLIPLSQMDGQKILFEIHDIIKEIVNIVSTLDEDDLGMSCIGFDIRSMQHERLYTRLYIS
ncbi:MAG: urease accessory protein UreF [Ruminiclostridium sp.]